MPKVTIERPAPGTVVAAGQSVPVSGTATGTGGLEPHLIDSVMVGIGGSGASFAWSPSNTSATRPNSQRISR
jgi:hypothetical protein